MAKQVMSSENRKPTVDATPKKMLTVAETVSDVTRAELEKELEELQASLERIREQHFSSSAALMRIEKRSFYDLIKARLYVLQNKREEHKKPLLKSKGD